MVPGRLMPQLKPERLPLIGLYKGKKKTRDGLRDYHDVIFMKGDDRRVTSLCMLQGSTARREITFDSAYTFFCIFTNIYMNDIFVNKCSTAVSMSLLPPTMFYAPRPFFSDSHDRTL